MTMPTAAQIEAAVASPTFVVQVHNGTSYDDVSADVVSVEGEYQSGSSSDDGIGFGLAPAPSQSITFAREQISRSWDNRAIKTSLGFNGTNPLHFIGIINEAEHHRLGGSWRASGYQDLIAATPEVRTGLYYRRPLFTATSAVSNENPDAGGATGIGNILLWRAGGRPYAQSATYPTATFYYECSVSIMAPEWSWLNGGDAAQALDELCKTAGGVLFQGTDGVVRYQEPMVLGVGTPTIHYTDNVSAASAATRAASSLAQYGDIRRVGKTRRQVVDVVRCAFVARKLQGVQQVYSDTTTRMIEASSALVITLDITLPIYRVSRVVATGYTMRSTRETTTSELTVSIGTTYAQQVSVTLTNTLTEPVGVSALTVFAMPLVAMEEGTATYGTPGTPPRSYAVPDSVYIQSKSYADRLCRMYYDFYGTARPVVELTGCGYDPRRYLGEIVTLTDSVLGISAVSHRVIGISVSRTGVEMTLRLVSVAGLPVSSDFFDLGTSYSDANSRQLVY